MYSLPSTSIRREPLPSRMKMGYSPKLTGPRDEELPPSIRTSRVRSYTFFEPAVVAAVLPCNPCLLMRNLPLSSSQMPGIGGPDRWPGLLLLKWKFARHMGPARSATAPHCPDLAAQSHRPELSQRHRTVALPYWRLWLPRAECCRGPAPRPRGSRSRDSLPAGPPGR